MSAHRATSIAIGTALGLSLTVLLAAAVLDTWVEDLPKRYGLAPFGLYGLVAAALFFGARRIEAVTPLLTVVRAATQAFGVGLGVFTLLLLFYWGAALNEITRGQ